MKKLLIPLVAALLLSVPALADYSIKDGNGIPQTVQSGNCGGKICSQSVPIDPTGNPISSSNPLPIKAPTGSIPNTTQISCGTTATLLLSADATKSVRSLSNQSGSMVYLGGATVTTSTGIPFPTGSGWDASHFIGALYCIVASGSATIGTLSY